MSEKQALINFHGDQIQTVRTEQGIYVALKPVAVNLGLDWKSQRAKLNLSERWGVITLPLETSGGEQLAMCIPLRKLNGWLFSINPDKVLPIMRKTVIDYQEECFHALYDYWHGKKEEKAVAIPDFGDPVAAARAWADAKEGELKAQLALKEAEPKIAFAEHMEKTPDSISVRQFAIILNKKGYKTGRTRLFEKFIEKGWTTKEWIGGSEVNIPLQHTMDYGWFEFSEYTMDSKNGKGESKKRLCGKLLVTGKGQVSITKILLRELGTK